MTRRKIPLSRLLKLLAAILAIALLTLAAMITNYDIVHFQPVLSEARKKAQATALTPMLARHLQVAHGSSLQFHTAKVLLLQSDMPGTDGLTAFYWGKLVEFHLSHSEQLSIIASQAFLGAGHYGFPAAAQAMFGKSVDQLSASESATLVALLLSPSHYLANPERLAQRRDYLLDQAGKHAF